MSSIGTERRSTKTSGRPHPGSDPERSRASAGGVQLLGSAPYGALVQRKEEPEGKKKEDAGELGDGLPPTDLPTVAEFDAIIADGLGETDRTPAPEDPGTKTETTPPPTTTPDMTGIASKVAVGRFTTAAKEVETKWGTMTADKRGQTLGDAANKELKNIGVPETTVVVKPISAKGRLDFKGWNLLLDKPAFEAASITKEEVGALAGTTLHEARHGEQWHRMARLEAGKGKKGPAIATALSIKPSVAEDAAQKPLPATSKEGKEADAWYQSVYGTGRAKRAATHRELKDAAAASKAALAVNNQKQKAFETVAKTAGATPAQKKTAKDSWIAAYNAWKAAKTRWETAYAKYWELAEEGDARKVTKAVEASYRSK